MPASALSRSQSFSFFGDEGALKRTERPQFPNQPTHLKAAASDPELAQKRLPRFTGDTHVGANALVLLQALTGGHRTWVGAPPGSKSLGQVTDEMARMEAGLTMDDPLQQLELREHSLALRVQSYGIWSDPNHTPNTGYVMESDLFALVVNYNQVCGLRPDLSWGHDLLRKAFRVITDPGLVGDGKSARKLRAVTLCNLGGLERRKGKLDTSIRYLNKALIFQQGLMHNFAHKVPENHVGQNAVMKFRFAAKGLMNLDRGGASDPFLRVGRMQVGREQGTPSHWRDAKDASLGKVVGKTVWKTNVVMNDLSPRWDKFEIDASRFCGCDTTRMMHYAVYDWDKDGTHDLIGMTTASFKDLEALALKKKGLPLVHPKSKLKTGTLYVTVAQISDEQEQKLLILQAEVALNMAATYSANNAPEAALKWAKKGLISLLTGGKLPSDAPIPQPSAIDALMTLPRAKVILLAVAYHAIGACQRRLGLPSNDAFDTSVAIESRLLAAQRLVQLAEEEEIRLAEEGLLQDALKSKRVQGVLGSPKPKGAKPAAAGGGLIPQMGGAAGKNGQSVEQELHTVKTRYLPTTKRSTSPSRSSRLRPETRGWTPTDRSSHQWRSATATPSPNRSSRSQMESGFEEGFDRPQSVDFTGLPSLGAASNESKSPTASEASVGGASGDGGGARTYTNAEHTATAIWS